MHRILLMLCLSLSLMTVSGCSLLKFGWEREDRQKVEKNDKDEKIPRLDGPSGGRFDKDGNWIPNDPTIAATYKIPDIGAGFVFDINSLDVSPSIQIELLEFDTKIPYIRKLKLDLGVAYQRAYGYLGKLFTNIFEISAGIFVGWNWEDNILSYGVGATIIRF